MDHKKKTLTATEGSVKKMRTNQGRRTTLRKLLASGAVVATSQTVPDKWSKPVVDSVMLPAHAQTSGGAIIANWVLGDDAPGGTSGMGPGTSTATDFLYDDGTSSTITAAVSPASAGVPIHLDISVAGTTFSGFDTAPADSASTDGAGVASFLDSTSVVNDDFGDTPGDGSVTMTFSSPGYASSVIILSVG